MEILELSSRGVNALNCCHLFSPVTFLPINCGSSFRSHTQAVLLGVFSFFIHISIFKTTILPHAGGPEIPVRAMTPRLAKLRSLRLLRVTAQICVPIPHFHPHTATSFLKRE